MTLDIFPHILAFLAFSIIGIFFITGFFVLFYGILLIFLESLGLDLVFKIAIRNGILRMFGIKDLQVKESNVRSMPFD